MRKYMHVRMIAFFFCKEYADLNKYPTCGEFRWKNQKNVKTSSNQVPAKVLWYFPHIPRFKHMFQSSQTAENLTWHAIH